jgi:hypothetical protein
MLNITWPDEYYNSYEEPSETMEVIFNYHMLISQFLS